MSIKSLIKALQQAPCHTNNEAIEQIDDQSQQHNKEPDHNLDTYKAILLAKAKVCINSRKGNQDE